VGQIALAGGAGREGRRKGGRKGGREGHLTHGKADQDFLRLPRRKSAVGHRDGGILAIYDEKGGKEGEVGGYMAQM